METILVCKICNLSINWGLTEVSNIFNKATIVQSFMLEPLNKVYWCILTHTNLNIRNSLDLQYEKTLILDNFNVEVEEAVMKSFYENYSLKSLLITKKNLLEKKQTNLHAFILMFQSTC